MSIWDCYDEELRYIGTKKMAKNKDYMASDGYAFDKLDEAVAHASRRVAKNMDTVRIYKAIQEVNPTTPNVVVTDLTI